VEQLSIGALVNHHDTMRHGSAPGVISGRLLPATHLDPGRWSIGALVVVSLSPALSSNGRVIWSLSASTALFSSAVVEISLKEQVKMVK